MCPPCCHVTLHVNSLLRVTSPAARHPARVTCLFRVTCTRFTQELSTAPPRALLLAALAPAHPRARS
eukprot:6823356-Prymnesium_polylepis.1